MKIKLNITPIEDKDISEFELGNMTIQYNDLIITSKKDDIPYQHFMLFPSMSNLLDGLNIYVQNNKKKKNFRFKAIDSSFEMLFEIKGNLIIVNKKIQIPLTLFLKKLYDSINTLYLEYNEKVNDSSGVFDDLKKSLNDFKPLINIS